MYKAILVPLDGSKRAEKILPHVENMAVRYKAKVIFLTAMEHVFAAGIEGSFIQYSEKDLNAQLEQAKSYLNKITENFHKKDISTQTVVANGPAVERIIQTAEKDEERQAVEVGTGEEAMPHHTGRVEPFNHDGRQEQGDADHHVPVRGTNRPDTAEENERGQQRDYQGPFPAEPGEGQ